MSYTASSNVRTLHERIVGLDATPAPPTLLERLFVGRTPGEALELATALLEERAQVVAMCRERGDDFELALVELREACAAKSRARERLLASVL